LTKKLILSKSYAFDTIPPIPPVPYSIDASPEMREDNNESINMEETVTFDHDNKEIESKNKSIHDYMYIYIYISLRAYIIYLINQIMLLIQ